MGVEIAESILVVEDEPALRMLLQAGLRKAGYRVIEAYDGLSGVAQFLQVAPSLVLMDVNMPVMDGFEACRKIRSESSGMFTPVLMLTGSDDVDSIQVAFDAGATDFITKPINLPLLLQRIRYALRDAGREREILRIQKLQDSASQMARLVFWEYNSETEHFDWMPNAAELLRWPYAMPISREDVISLIHQDDHLRYQIAFSEALNAGVSFDIEIRVGSNGHWRLLNLVGQRDTHHVHHLIGAVQDVTRQRRMEQQEEYLNHHDSITGLPNRRFFLHSLDQQLKSCQPGIACAVLVIEISRFQQIVDAYGVDTSEQLLGLVAGQLQSALTRDTLLSYLESGVFALHRLFEPDEQLQQSTAQWLTVLDRPWMVGGRELFLNFGAGISLSSVHGQDALTLLRLARQEALSVRAQGTVSLQLASSQSESIQQRLSLEADLRKAVEQQDFTLVYQPQLHLASNAIKGVEALVRWNRPGHGPVSPVQFISVLEELGLIHELGAWIFHEACRQQVAWSESGMLLEMGINLSPAQFIQPDLFEQVMRALRDTGADPCYIKLEITESLAMHDPEAAIRLLNRFRNERLKLAIDDFGIGFSSLEYLLRFPLDTLKIDRAFVTDITRGRSDRAIVRALTSLCHELGLVTIAEGVETQRQCDYLDAIGVNEIQGYLISRPLPPEDLVAFVRHHEQLESDAGQLNAVLEERWQ